MDELRTGKTDAVRPDKLSKEQEDNMARTNFNRFIYNGKSSKSGKFIGSRKKRRKRAK